MSFMTGAFIIGAACITAAISGVFGMAGGLLLKGALALVLPVSATFVVHGILQLVANGWRAVLHRKHIAWRIIWIYVIGAVMAAAVAGVITVIPTTATLYLFMGLAPWLVWLPNHWVRLDAQKPVQALICGITVTGVNLTAGVAGPFLDIFFVRTSLTRHQIVATKAATQVFSHLAKIIVYGMPLLAADGVGMPPLWVFAIAIPMSLLGTAAGGVLLNRLTDIDFKRYLRLILSGIGLIYLAQAVRLYLGAG